MGSCWFVEYWPRAFETKTVSKAERIARNLFIALLGATGSRQDYHASLGTERPAFKAKIRDGDRFDWVSQSIVTAMIDQSTLMIKEWLKYLLDLFN